MSHPTLRLYHGDCLELLRSLPDASVSLVVTDPPYGTTNLPFDKVKIDWKEWWAEIHRVSTPTAIVAVFAAQPFTTDLINSNRKNFRYDLVWEKAQAVGFLSANVRALRAHESVLIFCRRFGRLSRGRAERLAPGTGSVYNPQMTEGEPYTHRSQARPATHYSASKALPERRNAGTRFPRSVVRYATDKPSCHPTAKPLALCQYLVRTYSHLGDVVLDTFAGGGSVPLAALLEGRSAVASEMDPLHVATIRRRAHDLGLPEPCLTLSSRSPGSG